MTLSSDLNSKGSSSVFSKLAPLEAILFDVDGTLCNSDPIHYQAYREMLPEIGFNDGVPITEEYYSQYISGKHNEDMATFFFPDDHQRGLKFTDDKEAMFRKMANDKLKAVNGLDKLKKWIEDRGLRRAAVTNAPRENAELMISTLGLTDFFEAVILGNECEHGKPFPDPYLKALEVLNISKEHTFIFEDSVSGIKAGVAAGMPVVALTTGNPEHRLMEAKPSLVIKDFADPKLWAVLQELDPKAGIA